MSEALKRYEAVRKNLLIRAKHVNSAVGDEKLARFIDEEEAAFSDLKAEAEGSGAASDAQVTPSRAKGKAKAEEAPQAAPEGDADASEASPLSDA